MQTIKKTYNSILPHIYAFLGKTYLPYYPSKISIESGNLCNLCCPLCPTDQQEINKARELAEKMGIKIKVSKMRPDMGKEVFETTQQAIERDKAWLPDNPEFSVISKKRRKRIGCTLPWTETMINWDGNVLPCCAVYSEKYAFGNILENSFAEIWNNEMYVSARKEILGRKNTKHTICHT